eukprot:1641332-Pleurochrysis_carterae.AAC.1
MPRAMKRRLASVVEAAARAQVADETWERMDAAEQNAAVRVYMGDCAQNAILCCRACLPQALRILTPISRTRSPTSSPLSA